MRPFASLYVANVREFMRDQVALVVSLVMPLLFAFFFGLLFGDGNGISLRVGLVREDQGAVGQQVAAMLQSGDLAKLIVLTEGKLEPLLEELRQGERDLVMVLPTDLSQRIGQQEPVAFPVYYDSRRQISADAGLSIVRNLISQANLMIAQAPSLLSVDPESVEGQNLGAASFYVPSMLGLGMLWLGVFGTAQPLIQMREQQVLRRLAVTPLSRRMVLAAQVAWRVTVGLVQAALFLAMGFLVFDIRLSGGPWLFPPIVLLGTVSFVTLGYFIAAVSPSSDSAVAIAQVINFAMTFFSGSFFQPEFLPSFLQPLLYVMPLTYFSDALRQVMAGFPPFVPLYVDVAVLGGFLLLMVPLTIRFWRWE